MEEPRPCTVNKPYQGSRHYYIDQLSSTADRSPRF